MDVPHARRVAQPTWLNSRTILGAILFVLAFVAGHRYLQAANTTSPVWVAARDLPQDSVIGPEDLRVAEARFPADLAGTYASASREVEGLILTSTVRSGELIPQTALGQEAADGSDRSITLPVVPEHAVGGALRTGDRIDVYATFDPGDVRARTVLLARAVEILDTVSAGSSVLGEGAIVGVTVAVSQDEAARLAFATRTGELDLVKVLGAAGTAPSSTVSSQDLP
jgi:Flp pilus assembly protein CpaB